MYKLASIITIFAALMFTGPVLAGKNKTMDAWLSNSKFVKSKITDVAALKQIKEWHVQMEDGHFHMDRLSYYNLAAEIFDELIDLSKENGGPKVHKPDWLD